MVLNLNPFFLLEDDPTPQRNDQVVRAASLIYSTLTFIDALRKRTLEPDVFRGTPLCMSQFTRLFATSRVPTDNGCYIAPSEDSRHIVVLAHSQFYHFEVFDENGEFALTEKEIAQNLRAIKNDARKVPVTEIAKNAIGVLTTENRRNWARLRRDLQNDPVNRDALQVVDTALFIVCLDHVTPSNVEELSTNMLCGTYKLDQGLQVGTCTNRWYDKLQVNHDETWHVNPTLLSHIFFRLSYARMEVLVSISSIQVMNDSWPLHGPLQLVSPNTLSLGVDGHTVLRYVSDIYTDTILRFAKTINSQTKSIFHSQNTQDASAPGRRGSASSGSSAFDSNPRRIEWNMTRDLTLGVRFAETRLSDLILQNEVKVLEFTKYGKYFITDMKMSPDAFVQVIYLAIGYKHDAHFS